MSGCRVVGGGPAGTAAVRRCGKSSLLRILPVKITGDGQLAFPILAHWLNEFAD